MLTETAEQEQVRLQIRVLLASEPRTPEGSVELKRHWLADGSAGTVQVLQVLQVVGKKKTDDTWPVRRAQDTNDTR